MYYDDAEGRSVVDDATDAGNAKNIDMYHGCHSATVKGTNPVDYDGKPLMNSADTAMLSKRIIGNPNAGSGTAEPEMRGLYILLTINNDGGMEVLKYALAFLVIVQIFLILSLSNWHFRFIRYVQTHNA